MLLFTHSHNSKPYFYSILSTFISRPHLSSSKKVHARTNRVVSDIIHGATPQSVIFQFEHECK